MRSGRTQAAVTAIAAIAAGTVAACSHPAAAPPAASPALSSSAVAAADPGWPVPRSAYLGRYRLTWSSDRTFAASGLLTLFMRTITKPKQMIVPSGVISVYTNGGTSVLYLTRLSHLGSRGVADVQAGLYSAAPAGTAALTAFSAARHTLTLVLTAPGAQPVTLRFTRYSANPHP